MNALISIIHFIKRCLGERYTQTIHTNKNVSFERIFATSGAKGMLKEKALAAVYTGFRLISVFLDSAVGSRDNVGLKTVHMMFSDLVKKQLWIEPERRINILQSLSQVNIFNS